MSKKVIFKFLPLVIIVFAASFLYFAKYSQAPSSESLGIKNEATVTIGNTTIFVEIVDTAPELEKGLSGKVFLADNAGMLFKFSDKRTATFWMKDMLIPIDIIWISDDKVVGVEASAQPPNNEQIPTFTSPEPVNWVLEVNAGFAKDNNLEKGAEFELLK
jgi:uncharacterized membrane protein (UPF0127 family)